MALYHGLGLFPTPLAVLENHNFTSIRRNARNIDVVRADFQTDHLVDFRAFRGEHDDRYTALLIVEILAMQEVPSGLLDRLHDAGIEDYLPYSVSVLRHFPKNPWAIILGLLVLCLLLPFWGNIVTYLEPADKHYLLVKEEEVLDHVKKATGRAFRFWAFIQTLIFILVVPLFLALGRHTDKRIVAIFFVNFIFMYFPLSNHINCKYKYS